MGYVTCDAGEQITQSGPGSIVLGTTMTPGQWAISPSSTYILIFQTDGNLVLYQIIGAPPVANSSFTGFALWTTATAGNGAQFCVQIDSNLVVYDADGSWLWESGTNGSDADNLEVQDDGNLVLYTSDGVPVWTTGTNHSQVWPKSGWVTLQSSAVTGSPPYVLTAASDGSLTISAVDDTTPSQLWQLAPDGRILSALLGGQVLIAGTVGNGTATVTNTAQILPGDSNQIWMCSSQLNAVSILNLGTNLFLCPESPQADASVQAADSSDPWQWYMVPANPLDAVMALQSADPGFPAFKSDGQEVYAYINTQLGLTTLGETLRGEYANRNAPLSSYQTRISTMHFGSFSKSVWEPVRRQLNDELTATIAVQSLFSNYRIFYSGLMADKDSLLLELGTDAGFEIDEKTGVGGVILAVISSMIYTVLSAGGTAWAALANLLQSAVNVAVAANGVGTISASPFQVAYADLWGQLSTSFSALESTIGDIEQAILSDWTKLSTTYPLTLSSAPNGLAWPANADQVMTAAATQGYIVSVMQMLLPAKYRIYQYASAQVNDPDVPDDYTNAPDWAKYESGNINGYYYYYWIADNANSSTYPAQVAMDQLWNNGVSQNDFYAGNNGWALPKSLLGNLGASLLAVAITNLTPNMLTTKSACVNGELQSPATVMLAPYSTILALGAFTGIASLGLTVSIYDTSTGDALIGKISAEQTPSFLAKGTVTVVGQSSAGNYSLTTAIACQPSVETHYSGSVQVSVAFGC